MKQIKSRRVPSGLRLSLSIVFICPKLWSNTAKSCIHGIVQIKRKYICDYRTDPFKITLNLCCFIKPQLQKLLSVAAGSVFMARLDTTGTEHPAQEIGGWSGDYMSRVTSLPLLLVVPQADGSAQVSWEPSTAICTGRILKEESSIPLALKSPNQCHRSLLASWWMTVGQLAEPFFLWICADKFEQITSGSFKHGPHWHFSLQILISWVMQFALLARGGRLQGELRPQRELARDSWKDGKSKYCQLLNLLSESNSKIEESKWRLRETKFAATISRNFSQDIMTTATENRQNPCFPPM